MRKRLASRVNSSTNYATFKSVTTAFSVSVILIKEFGVALELEDFLAIVEESDMFKKRHNIVQKSVYGKSFPGDFHANDD